MCKIEEEASSEIDEVSTINVPRYGILMQPDIPPIVVVCGTQTSRDMKKIVYGGLNKTYKFPNTTVIIGECAFRKNKIISVRLNDGLKTLKKSCFTASRIQKLVLPSSVMSVDSLICYKCKNLECADLSAACGLKSIGKFAFDSCRALK